MYVTETLIPSILTTFKMTKTLDKYKIYKNRLHKLKALIHDWRNKIKIFLGKDKSQIDNKKNDKIYTEDDINKIKDELQSYKDKIKTIQHDLTGSSEKPKIDSDHPKTDESKVTTDPLKPEIETTAEVYSVPNFSNGKDSVSKAFKHIIKNVMTSDDHEELKNLLKLKENNKGSSMENISNNGL